MEEKKPAMIYNPDFSLKRKIGNVDISKIIDETVIKKGESIIEDSADRILQEILQEVTIIDNHINMLQEQKQFTGNSKAEIISVAFSIKSKAGLCGYPLVSALAKSLHLFCETQADGTKLLKQQLDIILWHREAIRAVLSNKLKDKNSEFAKALLVELEKIKTNFLH